MSTNVQNADIPSMIASEDIQSIFRDWDKASKEDNSFHLLLYQWLDVAMASNQRRALVAG